ncbi:MAG: translation initiation factor IF-2 [Lachnospiraceae bacterium]|nr:translation initiation factor IF-2 [Lachnospiraceae bacterium]
MAKMRIYELAKELGLSSKDVVSYLNGQGIDAKTSSSNIEDDAISSVRKHFGGEKKTAPAADKPAVKTAAPVKPAAPVEKKGEKTAPEKKAAPAEALRSGEAKPAARPEAGKTVSHTEGKAPVKKEGQPPQKKKSTITAVFNAQYSKKGQGQGGSMGGHGQRRPAGGQRRPEAEGSRFRNDGGAQAHRVIRPRTEGERRIRPRGLDNVNEEIEIRPAGAATAPAVDRPSRPEPAREQVRENTAPAAKASETASNTETSESAPKAAPKAEGPRMRVQGNIFANRPQAAAQAGGNRNRRTDRPAAAGNGKPGFRKGAESGRPAPAAGAGDSKRGGQGGFGRKGPHGKKAEHDALGSKKQERFVNLEKNGGKKKHHNPVNKTPERNKDEILTIQIPEHITIKDLAEKMMIKPADVVKDLFMHGKMVTLNSDLTYDEAEEIALNYNCITEQEEKEDVIAELLKEDEEAENEDNMVPRPPVVCVMGHVDHGKTSLLDAIRDTKVTDREAGGITQKIGAYVVNVKDRKITFLDTPGHEAFTAMRMRGANSTDIAILVVAADDGVMPQTVEAINHAKAAGVEIIVAVNKIDKPSANVERVKQELSEYELIPEDWGGSTIFVPVSAHTHEGIDDLLDMILLTADVMELKADPKRNARGVVIEAELDKGRGAVATVLVQKGTLHVGDPVAAGSCYGKVRAMLDENGKHVKKAGPSTPVEILGLSDVPNAGEIFMSFDSEKEAHSFADTFVSEGKKSLIEETRSRMSLDDLFSKIQEGSVKELDIVVKADVQGSVEAVRQSLEKLSNDEVVVKVIHGGVGAINESDVTLAAASNAVIIGFNVRPDAVAKQIAEREGVDLRLYDVIYNAIADVEDAMKGMLEPVYEEKVIGHAEVRQIFKSSDVGNIAGSIVTDGTIERDCSARITRGKDQIFEGKVASLKRFKDDVKEVKTGFECGIVFEGFSDLLEGDVIEAYKMVEVPRS